MLCDDVTDTDTYAETMNRVVVGTVYPRYVISFCVEIAGLIIVFGCFSHREKPFFVKVIWSLLCVDLLMNLIYGSLFIFTEHGFFDHKANYKLISSLLNQVVHWLFAQEYFKVILNFPLLLIEDPNEILRRARRIKNILIVCNITFYAFVLLWLFL